MSYYNTYMPQQYGDDGEITAEYAEWYAEREYNETHADDYYDERRLNELLGGE